MTKIAIFSFRGDPLCFVHVMLNALDLNAKGHEVKVILEGESVKLVRQMIESENAMFRRLMDNELIACICKACSNKMGVLEYNANCGIPLADEMNGHPAMATWLESGFQIITQ